jgi:hypothetical protein
LNENNVDPCDDGDVCTTGDVCLDGTCAGGPLPQECGNGCTEAGEQCGEPGLECPSGQFLVCGSCACATPTCATTTLESSDFLSSGTTSVEVELVIDHAAFPLGAYAVDLAWNPLELSLDGVFPGPMPEFSDTPNCNIDNGAGTARCSSLQTATLDGPLGVSHVASLQFTVLDPGNPVSSITVTPLELFDTAGDVIDSCTTSSQYALAGRCGDVNASAAVSITDALLAAQYSVAIKTCSELDYYELCDIAPDEGDGNCSIGDAMRMAQCAVGLVPCTFECDPITCD